MRDELSHGGPGANQLIIVIAESEDVAQPVQVRFNSKKQTDSIQALFVPSNMASQDTVIDSLQTFLKNLRKIDDMGLDEYLDKVEHREELFGPEDMQLASDEAGEPKLKNQALYDLYSEDRFKIARKHSKELK